jgi:hypothetical protein
LARPFFIPIVVILINTAQGCILQEPLSDAQVSMQCAQVYPFFRHSQNKLMAIHKALAKFLTNQTKLSLLRHAERTSETFHIHRYPESLEVGGDVDLDIERQATREPYSILLH